MVSVLLPNIDQGALEDDALTSHSEAAALSREDIIV